MIPSGAGQRSGDLRLSIPTPLFGRSAEHAQVLALLADRQVRLVSLTGRGGVGKTRLAAEVMRALCAGPGAVSVIPVALEGITTADLVMPEIAAALGIPPLPGIDVTEAVTHRLQRDRVLLALDNFEHVLGATGSLDQVIRACPGLSILVTSQAPLKLRYEHVVALDPLPTPDADLDDPNRLADQPSVAIYCARAAAVDRHFRLDESNAAAVATLCRQLEGLPLAIELAATRAATLPAGELVRRFDADQLTSLRVPLVDTPDRHHDLRAAIDWSYRLLAPTEQHLFRRLSVFTGGFDLDAAEQMVDRDEPIDVFDALSALVDMHLVDPVRGTDPARFSMPSSIRRYAGEQLRQAGDEEPARRRHVGLRARQARAASIVESADESLALRALEADHDDLLAALDEALNAELVGAALDLISGAAPLWDVSGYHPAHEAQVERALTLARTHDIESVAHADVLAWSALLGLRHRPDADRTELTARLQRGEGMARALADANSCLRALTFWLVTAPYTGDLGRAQRAADDGLELATSAPHRRWLGRFQVLAGMMAQMQGDIDRAVSLGRAALAGARAHQDSRTIVMATILLGPLKAKHPEIAAEIPMMSEALALARSVRSGALRSDPAPDGRRRADAVRRARRHARGGGRLPDLRPLGARIPHRRLQPDGHHVPRRGPRRPPDRGLPVRRRPPRRDRARERWPPSTSPAKLRCSRPRAPRWDRIGSRPRCARVGSSADPTGSTRPSPGRTPRWRPRPPPLRRLARVVVAMHRPTR